jgi:hypothetical protein
MNKVVHCKRDKYDVYIGRPHKSIPEGTPGADGFWGNPFSVKKDDGIEIPGSRALAVKQYMNWLSLAYSTEIWYDKPRRSNRQVMSRLGLLVCR